MVTWAELWPRIAESAGVAVPLPHGPGRLLAALRAMGKDGKIPSDHPAYVFLHEVAELREMERRWVTWRSRPGAPVKRPEHLTGVEPTE